MGCADAEPRVSASDFAGHIRNTMHQWNKIRLFPFVEALPFLALAICVFAWGLQYKLSLYDPPHAASHQIPQAKLLSRDQQTERTEVTLANPLRVVASSMAAPLSSMLLFALISLFGTIATAFLLISRGVSRLWRLRGQAYLSTLFVRPPPVLA